MKYTPEITNKLVELYKAGNSVQEIAALMTLEYGEAVPDRSIIAKLSSLGVYQRKTYVNKRGEVPVKKSEHIERIADLLDCDLELLESLEKVNKLVLKLIEQKLQQSDPKPQ